MAETRDNEIFYNYDFTAECENCRNKEKRKKCKCILLINKNTETRDWFKFNFKTCNLDR